MNDPYKVLGVSPNATDDEIKKAYRNLCRKYHPDVNQDNPKAAEEKFKEVGEAYRTIMDMRSGRSQYDYTTYSQSSDNSDSRLRAASVYIQRGYFREAINTLNSITDRNAMWYYLSAVANARVGNNILAREYARIALSMEPDNQMYKNLNAALNGEGGFYEDYRRKGQQYGREFSFDTDYCIKCCAANLALNICCCNNPFCCC